jgi:hypothetical protein
VDGQVASSHAGAVSGALANVDDLSAMLPGPVEEKIAFGLKIGSIDGST